MQNQIWNGLLKQNQVMASIQSAETSLYVMDLLGLDVATEKVVPGYGKCRGTLCNARFSYLPSRHTCQKFTDVCEEYNT